MTGNEQSPGSSPGRSTETPEVELSDESSTYASPKPATGMSKDVTAVETGAGTAGNSTPPNGEPIRLPITDCDGEAVASTLGGERKSEDDSDDSALESYVGGPANSSSELEPSTVPPSAESAHLRNSSEDDGLELESYTYAQSRSDAATSAEQKISGPETSNSEPADGSPDGLKASSRDQASLEENLQTADVGSPTLKADEHGVDTPRDSSVEANAESNIDAELSVVSVDSLMGSEDSEVADSEVADSESTEPATPVQEVEVAEEQVTKGDGVEPVTQRSADFPAPDMGMPGVGDSTYAVTLDVFEGPLDLLLHLVRRHELSILEIPISFITEKYLEYLDFARALDLEVAGEYLVMAATLLLLKSRELLPQQDEEPVEGEEREDESDPREELIQRLIEYEKFRDAGEKLGQMPITGRDVFERGRDVDISTLDPGLASSTLFRLAEAFQQILERAKITKSHEVVMETVSVRDRMIQLNRLLIDRGTVEFTSLFLEREWSCEEELRGMLVVTLISLLELVKIGVVGIHQASVSETIVLKPVGDPTEARQLVEEFEDGGRADDSDPEGPKDENGDAQETQED